MKRGRKPSTPAVQGVSPALYEMVREKLEQDYLDLVHGTSNEEPRLLAARIAAAGELLGHIAQLATLVGAASGQAESEDALLLAAARAALARENKT